MISNNVQKVANEAVDAIVDAQRAKATGFPGTSAEAHAELGENFPSASELTKSIKTHLDQAVKSGELNPEDLSVAVDAAIDRLEEFNQSIAGAERSQASGPYHSDSSEFRSQVIQAARAKLADKIRTEASASEVLGFDQPKVSMDVLNFDSAKSVVTNQDRATAMRFSIPIPAMDGKPLVYPDTYPKDMVDKETGKPDPRAGQPYPDAGKKLTSWDGSPVTAADGSDPKGLMFFNYEDGKYQGVQTDGNGILLINRFDEARGRQFEGEIARLGGPDKLNLETLEAFLKFANSVTPKGNGHAGLDVYDSDLGYAAKKLTAISDLGTGENAYGMHLRTNEQVQAIFVQGPGQVGNAPVSEDGAVFVLVGTSKEGKRDIRHITPEAFTEGYVNADGSSIDLITHIAQP